MNKLDKINFIIKACNTNEITAYSIAKGTGLTAFGIDKILDGTTKNPRSVTLDAIIKYIEHRLSEEKLKLEEPAATYEKRKIEDIIAEKVIEKMLPYFTRIEVALAENLLDVDDIKEELKSLKKLVKTPN